MKKLITICLLIATTCSVNAQQKPTKEQTLAYLTKTFKLTEGEILLHEPYKKQIPELFVFSEKEISKKYKEYEWNTGEEDGIEKQTYTNMKWEDVISIKISSFNKGWSSDNLIPISVEFSSNIKIISNDKHTYYDKFISFSVIKSKAESFKKALERLVEIAKEENKNPFEN
jgi:hypothetical protein